MTSEFKNNKIEQNKIYEIPNCIDPKKFYKVNEEEKIKLRVKFDLPFNAKILIFTGRLLSTKGLPLLLRVWNEIQKIHSNAILLIVGSGKNLTYSCEDDIKEYVHKNKLEESVIFTGYSNNVDEYLKASDIFVFPTEDEAFGISLIEAMACGLPVITTHIGGINDIVKHNENGLLTDVGNSDQLYNCINLLLNDNNLIERIGKIAFQTIATRYSKSIVVQNYINLFNFLIEAHKSKFDKYHINMSGINSKIAH